MANVNDGGLLRITVSAEDVIGGFTELEERQLPFAMSKAINDTALQFQHVQIEHDESIFAPRRPDWQAKSIKISHFATKREPWAVIEVLPPGMHGADRADILAKFEDQTEKLPFKGHSVAVPTSQIKRNKNDIVPDALRPANLNLHAVGNRIIGDKRTFLVKLANGRSVIIQRIGHGARSVTAAIWQLFPFVHIKPDLHFEANAVKVVDSEWSQNFEEALDQAVRTAL